MKTKTLIVKYVSKNHEIYSAFYQIFAKTTFKTKTLIVKYVSKNHEIYSAFNQIFYEKATLLYAKIYTRDLLGRKTEGQRQREVVLPGTPLAPVEMVVQVGLLAEAGTTSRTPNLRYHIPYTECPKIYRKSILHLLQFTDNLYLSSYVVQICGKFGNTPYHIPYSQ